MADLDLARIKRNVAKMAAQNAPVEDIDGYIASEGTTIDAVRAFRAAPVPSPAQPTNPSPTDGVDAGGQRFEDGVPVGGRPVAAPAGDAPEADPKFGGTAMNFTAGLNDAIYGVAGALPDLGRGIRNLGARGINAVAGTDIQPLPENAGLGSRGIAEMMGSIRPELDPQNTEAKTAGERIARATGQGVAATVIPAGIVGTLERAGVAVSPLIQAVAGRSGSVPQVVGDAVAGGAAGAGASAAMEAAPDEWKPAAGLAGGVAGGGLGMVATGIPALVREGGRLVARAAEPFTAGGQQRMAARRLREGASDPQSILDADTTGAELVPGSMPTTGQLTGDMGVLAMERASQTRFPAEFNQRRADQNAARVGALESIQPTGSPEKVTASVRAFLKTIDDEADSAVATAAEAARMTAGGVGVGMRPDEAGASVRTAVETARAAAKERERTLWSAVDPDGTLALRPGNVRAKAADLLQNLPTSAKPPSGEEAAIFDVLGRYGDVVSFSEITALSSRLKSEMRAERMANGETQAYRRMSQLSAALHQDLEAAVAGKVRFEAREVAEGRLAPENTMEALVQGWADNWRGERQAVASSGGGSSGPVSDGPGRPTPVSGVRGATGQAVQRPGSAPRDPRLPQDAGRGAGEGFRPVSLTELRSLGPDDPYFIKSGDGQTFVPRVLSNGGERTPDLGFAPDLEAPGTNLPIRIRRTDMVKHVGNNVHQNDARALGYADSWEMVQDLSANWTQMHKGRYGRVQLVKPAAEHNGVAVVELAPSDDTKYWRIVSAHRNASDQLGETILTRELPLDAPSGNSAPLINGPPQGRQNPALARDRIEGEYTAGPSGGQGPHSSDATGSAYSEDRSTSSVGEGAGGLRAADPSSPPRPAATQYSAFDAEAQDRLNAANTATRERAQTFDNDTLGPIRQRSKTGDYKTLDASVAGKLFFGRPESAEAMARYAQAVGPEQARATIEPYAVDQARRAALRDDGTFDPAKLDRWRRQHQDALRALPELDARLADAGRAAETMGEVAASQRQTSEAAQKGALGRFVGIDSPEEVTRAVGSLFGRQDGPTQLAAIKRAIGNDPEAMEGLRKALADHIAGRLIGNTEVGTSGVVGIKSDQYQTFVRQNAALLRVVFSPGELRAMEAVALDMRRSNRSNVAVKLPGQSNTTQDTLAVQGSDSPTTILAKLLGTSAVAGGGMTAATGSVSGVLVGAGTLFAGAMREAGLRKVDELVRDALLDPHKAKVLLETVRPDERAKELGLVRRFRATLPAIGGISATGERQEPQRGPMALPATTRQTQTPPPWMTPDYGATPLQRAVAGRIAQ